MISFLFVKQNKTKKKEKVYKTLQPNWNGVNELNAIVDVEINGGKIAKMRYLK